MKRWQVALVIVTTSVLAPAGLVAWLVMVPGHTRAEIAAAIAVAVVWTAALFLVNWWEFTSIHLRWLWALLIGVGVVLRLLSWGDWPVWRGLNWQLGLAAVLVAVGAWMLSIGLFGRRHDAFQAVALTFPLSGGRFLVTDGGDGKTAPATNYHYGFATHRSAGVDASMRFATDIVEIGLLGGESKGFLPGRNDAYRIWERAVLAPMTGEVVHVVSDVADNMAFGPFRPYGVGNHVVLRDGDVYLVVGHLRGGSVECEVGQRVSAGEVIGRVGNSGWTERPHIHMQAMRAPDGDWWHGTPLAMTFRGRLLVRNDVLRA